MKTRTPLIRAALAMAMIGGAFAIERVPAAPPVVRMSVDATAPLHATLLPELSVSASASDTDRVFASKLAGSTALPVTLLPTVHVVAARNDVAMREAQHALDAVDAALFVAID